MKQEKPIRHEFVEVMPAQLERDVLYISLRYQTAVHLCGCGCGIKTVTPFHGSEGWTLTISEAGVTLSPSIGNWQFPCRSHYWIKDSMVVWA